MDTYQVSTILTGWPSAPVCFHLKVDRDGNGQLAHVSYSEALKAIAIEKEQYGQRTADQWSRTLMNVGRR